MYPNNVPPQGQQQPYPAAPFAGAPGYAAPPPAPAPAPSPQPVILNIQQNAAPTPPTLAAPVPIRSAQPSPTPSYKPPPSPVIMPQEESSNSCGKFCLGIICCPVIFFGILVIIALISRASSSGFDGPVSTGPNCGENVYTTTSLPYNQSPTPSSSFCQQGSINSNTVEFCEGSNHYEYSVSTSGTIQSPNYPNGYYPWHTCTSRFTTSSDGITFNFNNFTMQSYESLTFSNSTNEDYAFSGSYSSGTRFSFSSSSVTVFFVSESGYDYNGFQIDVINGYESYNDVGYVYANVSPFKKDT
ncbi:Oidioi.mRNA.OKI2018_I69.chr1.g712.t1.cds [Oikopleura dioica]|uniref:Oidioi.mRNA.OKI2018_I69.chr1.g712.t1.cds n=1 Tax=Oikopleura dioica TaxID=34765 RepID=A0ABN7SQV6_OIKDI|nr:Oidioi.mRNA.OKI2018_I69.chr1.g712.t1.cds [Oikopleura dioica]